MAWNHGRYHRYLSDLGVASTCGEEELDWLLRRIEEGTLRFYSVVLHSYASLLLALYSR